MAPGLADALAKADAGGNFSVHVGPLPQGDTRVDIVASAEGFGNSAVTITVTRTVSPGAYKASAASIPYNQLNKDPGALKGRTVTYPGQVFQYDTATTTSHFILSVTDAGYGYWTDHIWVDVDPSIAQNVFKGTVVRVWGDVVGPYTYTTTSNGQITIPEVKVLFLDVVSQP